MTGLNTPEGKLLAKTRDVVARITALKRERSDLQGECAAAWDALQAIQVREALTRLDLCKSLQMVIGAGAAAEALARAQAASAHAARAASRPLRRHNRLSRLLDRLLSRVGGASLVLSRSSLVGTALFDAEWYGQNNPDVVAAAQDPLLHYALRGAREGRAPHPLFDVEFYRRDHGAEVDAHGLSPLEHYLRVGAARGASPHPLFDVGHYLMQRPGLDADEDAASHYLRCGWREGLSPHPLFDVSWYAQQAPQAQGAPLVHYLTEGWRARLSPHPLFDAEAYLAQRHDLAEAGAEPLTHFVTAGPRPDGAGAASGGDGPPMGFRGSQGAEADAALLAYLKAVRRSGEAQAGVLTAACSHLHGVYIGGAGSSQPQGDGW